MFAKEIARRRALPAIGFLLSAVIASTALVACDSGGGSASDPGVTSVASGEKVYARYCNACHPGGERGAGPAIKPLLPKLTDDQIRAVIRKGKLPMPAYNEVSISKDQLTSLVLYMRTIK